MTRRNALIFAALVVVVGLASWLLVGRTRPLPGAPLARTPKNATAVVWVDVGAVLGSDLWERVVETHGGDTGIRRIERVCGFHPLANVTDVVVFASGDDPESLERVGVIARGPLDHERLVECVSKVVGDEGGEVRRVEIAGVPAVAGRGSSRAAFVGRDGVVAASEPLVRDVIGVLRDGAESALDDEVLSHLWDRVAGGRHIVLVGHVPEKWRESIRRTAHDAERPALDILGSTRAIGIGVRVTRGLGVGAALRMRDEDQAREAARVVLAEIDRTLDRPLIALSAIGPALRRVDAEAQDRELVLTLELGRSQVDDLVETVEDLFERQEERSRDRRAPRPTPEPDEILRPAH